MDTPTTRIPVTVYAEATPNPTAMKFVVSTWLLPDAIAEYASAEETVNSSPLAYELFTFPYIKNVFITQNFVSITKTDDVDWFEVTTELRMFIKEFIANGGEAITMLPPPKKVAEPEVIDTPNSFDHNEAVAKIMGVLDEYVRPAVEQDGGAITFQSFKDGVVSVALQGSCSGCPSSTVTLKNGIENLLKRMVPEVKEVVAVGA